MALPGGYNCRGCVWVGPARVESVWDSGATRNSIDKRFLKTLLENPETAPQVEDIFDISPLTCTSMQKGHEFTITKTSFVRVTFREDSQGQHLRLEW